MLRAVIFDMDGVIIDSHSVAYELLCESANEYGCALTVEQIKGWGSLSSRQFWTKVKTDYGLPQELSDLIRSYDADKEIQKYRGMMPIPGVKELLAQLRHSGIQTALATSASRYRTNAVLDLFGLHSLFDAVVCDDEVKASKPDPHIFTLASDKLAVPAQSCVVIEDSGNGLLAAQRAGMKCIGYKGLPHVHENMDGADLIVTDFSRLGVEEIVALVSV
ncbi:HAD family hydrolase [Paenibacillus kobensis]|uniref:HAD family hydrolase n=1 Tax=Paenibacillus kobensis TaxID=59841 RepID=UPI000FD9BAD7|nr:HAD family phosphatase [Paenibacillus kobensis]